MKAVCIHVALCGLVTAVVSGCDQPKPNCLTSQATFVLKLIEDGPREESAPGACAGFGPDSFYADPQVGIAAYYEKDKKEQPDYRKGSVALRTAELANLASAYEEHAARMDPPPMLTPPVLHSLGKFVTEEPDDREMCRAPELEPTRLVLPALPALPDDPETEEADPLAAKEAVDVTLAWSDFDVYVTPASFGTQVRAKLADRRVTPDGRACTIRYEARGLAPAVPCYKTKTEQQVTEDGKMETVEVPDRTADGKFQVDPSKCSPEPAPNADPPRFTGSGISPTANVECDPEIFYCVLAGPIFPALK